MENLLAVEKVALMDIDVAEWMVSTLEEISAGMMVDYLVELWVAVKVGMMALYLVELTVAY